VFGAESPLTCGEERCLVIFGLGGGGGLIPALLVGLELVLELAEVEDDELEGGGGRGL
jgi:hypothetical protein